MVSSILSAEYMVNGVVSVVFLAVNIRVHYHSVGSMKLNACILILVHMVYLKPKHKLGYCYIQTFRQLLYTHMQFTTQIVAQFSLFAPLSILR
jgi:hypothetical protein